MDLKFPQAESPFQNGGQERCASRFEIGLDPYRRDLRRSLQPLPLEGENCSIEAQDEHDPPGQLGIDHHHHEHRDNHMAHGDGPLSPHADQYSGPPTPPILVARCSMPLRRRSICNSRPRLAECSKTFLQFTQVDAEVLISIDLPCLHHLHS